VKALLKQGLTMGRVWQVEMSPRLAGILLADQLTLERRGGAARRCVHPVRLAAAHRRQATGTGATHLRRQGRSTEP
jgi:hypothetical protein